MRYLFDDLRHALRASIRTDGRYADLQSNTVPFFWDAFYQSPTYQAVLLVKSRTNAAAMIRLLSSEVRLEDDEPRLVTPTTHGEMVSMQTAVYGVIGKVLGSAGIFGLVLVVAGIYGVVSLAVTARTREMAIYQAVGARRDQVVRAVAKEGIALSLLGTVIGIALAVGASGLVESAVFGVSRLDPVAFGVPVSILILAAFFASHIPARRVTKLNSMQVLREE